MERFLAAARRRGAASERVDAVHDALGELEAMISHYAGSRSKFDSIVSGLSQNGSDHVDLRNKRAAFKAQSHLLGVQAEAQLACYIYRASDSNPNVIDAVGLRGLIGLQRFRANASWLVSSMRVIDDDDGNEREGYVPIPLAPLGGDHDENTMLGLLPGFCSEPLPQLKRYKGATGYVDFELEPDGVGAKAAVTCLVGHAFPNSFVRYCDDRNTIQGSSTRICTPCKVLILDTLVQRGLFAPAPPEVASYSDHRSGDVQIRDRERDRLALRDTVVYLGRGPEVAETPEVPRYEELLQYAFDRVGWDSGEFDVYRCQVEFPVLPSSAVVRFNLLEAPK